MSQQLECARCEAEGTIARYAAGTIAPEAAAAFEDHFLVCGRCQASVRAGSGARQQFRIGLGIRRAPYFRRWGIGLAAAAAVGVIALRGLETARIRQLGVVAQAPMYLDTPVRGSENDDAARFDAAIVAYHQARYDDALEHFAQLRGPEARVVVDFFSGVSALMLGRARAAEARLTSVIAAGPSPYYPEALYYRAKSHLMQGRKGAAVIDLRAAQGLPSPIAQQAVALLKQLEE
ncbi:MAG: tetratricopeptide repeat protein [Gemmatimonadota bacterium]